MQTPRPEAVVRCLKPISLLTRPEGLGLGLGLAAPSKLRQVQVENMLPRFTPRCPRLLLPTTRAQYVPLLGRQAPVHGE